MRRLGIGLAAVLTMMAAATSAFAAKDDIPPEARKAGMAAAPALIQAAQLPCTLTDARLMGTAPGEDKVKTTFYEIACKDALGYVLVAKDKTTPTYFDCVMLSGPGQDGKPNSLACKLPGNLNPGAGLTSLVTAAGRTCAIDKARYMGSTTEQSLYEIACHDGSGYILREPKSGGTPIVSMCAIFGASSGVKCELTPVAQQNAAIDQLATSSGKACSAVKDRRYVGSTADMTDFFEVACADGKTGYMLQVSPRGEVQQAIDCIKASSIAGGCTLTDTRQAQTEQIAVYTDLAKKAGFDCAVSKYADFPARTDGTEVVELACSNRADGGVGFFPAKGQPKVLDCLRAGAEGYSCSFSDVAPLYSKLSAQLKAKGKGSCVVNGARPYAQTSAGADLIEVACSDGGPGWVIEYAAGSSVPTDLLNCAQAKAMGGGGCQLPTNKTH